MPFPVGAAVDVGEAVAVGDGVTGTLVILLFFLLFFEYLFLVAEERTPVFVLTPDSIPLGAFVAADGGAVGGLSACLLAASFKGTRECCVVQVDGYGVGPSSTG